MNELSKYRFKCTLSLGDIYGQVIVWLAVVFASLAAALSLMSHPMYALAVVGLIIVVSLPFLLFAFVSTLFNHIEVEPIEETQRQTASSGANKPSISVKNAVA
ncbi:hypothetical protein [Pseudanabaena sp. PCC 6802]|uniref:hypothetical protein n=1 Tax=Pseudanabaena sp. PCC 6802 TaxID=118173 RepID=UPI0003616E78|nr:hypothetical protein [Pseudanabaena sp. PCC 6802]